MTFLIMHTQVGKATPVNSKMFICLALSKKARLFMNNEAILKIIYCFLSNFRVSTKSKAPSPPGLKRLESPGFSQRYPGNPYLKMDQKENLIDKELSLTVVLPGGVEKTAIVHGRYRSLYLYLYILSVRVKGDFCYLLVVC